MLRIRPVGAIVCALLAPAFLTAADPPAKTPIRGLVSMGA